MNTKADDSAGVLIHHDHYPVTFQYYRFTAEKVYVPQAVLSVAESRKPRRPTVVWIGTAVSRKYTPPGRSSWFKWLRSRRVD